MEEEIVKQIVFDKFKLEVTKETELSKIVHDSFSKVELLFDIEKALSIKIAEQDLMDIETIGDIVRIAEKHNAISKSEQSK